MTKTMTKHGNSYAVVIDRTMMDLMGITEKTPLDLSLKGDELVIRPIRDGHRRTSVMQAYAHVSRKHAAFLKRLA
ncbi:MAG: AbrB/MazE/SpoVT family DNA-binding domain-containing protein [Candidatus Coatesbacteria bacterium]